MDDFEIPEETKVLYREKQTELVTIIEAFASLEKSQEWATLKQYVFDKELQGIENRIKSESLLQTIDVSKLYRLQGRRDFARQFCDVNKYVEVLKKQLEEIKTKL